MVLRHTRIKKGLLCMREKNSWNRKGLPEKNNKKAAKPSVPQLWSYQYTRKHGTHTGDYMKCAHVENIHLLLMPKGAVTVGLKMRPGHKVLTNIWANITRTVMGHALHIQVPSQSR